MELGAKDTKHVLQEKENFRTDYLNLVKNSGVPEWKAKWYVIRIEQFARHIKIPFRECAARDVKGFLDNLSNDNRVEPWQVEQARDALRLLFRDFLKVSWALQNPVGAIHELPLQSGMSSGETASLNSDMFAKLQTEIRYRHYSIRTEQTYMQWVRRFLHFHGSVSAESLKAADVKKYLDYLAVEKKVSASTR